MSRHEPTLLAMLSKQANHFRLVELTYCLSAALPLTDEYRKTVSESDAVCCIYLYLEEKSDFCKHLRGEHLAACLKHFYKWT